MLLNKDNLFYIFIFIVFYYDFYLFKLKSLRTYLDLMAHQVKTKIWQYLALAKNPKVVPTTFA